MENGYCWGQKDVIKETAISDSKKIPIYQNQIVGIVSAQEEKRTERLQEITDTLLNASTYWVKGVRKLQDKVIRGDKTVVEKLKEQDAGIDDDFAKGLLAVVGIYDNRKTTELSSFERRKVQMIDAFATGANVLVMPDLYEGVLEEEKKELNQILIEFSVCKTILLTASGLDDIREICDKIFILDI